MRKFLGISFVYMVLAGGAFGQEAVGAPRVRVADLYLAKDDGSGKAGKAATGFATTDVPIYCVVQLDSSTPVTVRMNLVAVSVPGVKPGTRVVTTSYTTKDNQSRVNFTGRPNGTWVAGKYRVDIYVENLPAGSQPFIVESGSPALKSASEGITQPDSKATRNKKS